MKAKLLKRLRREGLNKITVYSITKTEGIVTGMRYGFNNDCYRGLFKFGDTEEEVRQKACLIFMRDEVKRLRGIKNKARRL